MGYSLAVPSHLRRGDNKNKITYFYDTIDQATVVKAAKKAVQEETKKAAFERGREGQDQGREGPQSGEDNIIVVHLAQTLTHPLAPVVSAPPTPVSAASRKA